MLNPVTAITAGALTLAIGGVLFVAAPFGDPPTAPPAAESEAGPVTLEHISASYRWSHSPESGAAVIDEAYRGTEGKAYLFSPVEVSDERFDGALVFTVNDRRYSDGGTEIQMGASRIEIGEGAWQEHPLPTLDFDRQPGDTVHRAFIGEGAYDGLIAFVVDTWVDSSLEFDGYVIDDEFLDAPTPYYPES